MKFFILIIALFFVNICVFAGGRDMIKEPAEVVKVLSGANIYIMPQPKEVSINNNFLDIRSIEGIVYLGRNLKNDRALKEFPELLKDRCDISINFMSKVRENKIIKLGIIGYKSEVEFSNIDIKTLKTKGEQAYAVAITPNGIEAVANDEAGLFYAMETISQIFVLCPVVNSVYILDYPSVKYRGMMYDISRGQMPKLSVLKSLARNFASAKGNMFELYLEDMFQWEKYPDIPPADALSKKDCKELFDYAARYSMEVHPMLQILGHFERIGSKPNYAKYMVPYPEDGLDGQPWTLTVDVRNPEAVEFTCNLMDEICKAFPGKYINVDVTEIAAIGYEKSGTPESELPLMMLKYIDTLADVCRKHDMKLLIAQSPLSATGHLNGIGQVIDQLPKDIPVASYYTAEFYGGWEQDFPLLQEKDIEFWANPWITSHTKFMPNITHAANFSDLTVERGLAYGVNGTVTCDWGDYGHIHLPGVVIYPSMYHCASAWTGAKIDRNYFDRAFSVIMFGANTDLPAKAIKAVGDINEVPVEKVAENGEIVVWSTHNTGNLTLGNFFFEFFGDLLEDKFISEIVNPRKRGEAILEKAEYGKKIFEMAFGQVNKNKNIFDQLVWSVRPYEIMGERLILRDKYLNKEISDNEFIKALYQMAEKYYKIREDYIELYMENCKESIQYENNIAQMQNTGDQAKILGDKISTE